MKFTNQKMDFEIPRAKLANYFFADIIMSKSTLLSFSFPSELQNFDFKLQKMTFDKVAMTYSFADFLTLNNIYKKTGYFESYNFASDLDIAFYRIISSTYYSESLFDVRKIDLVSKNYRVLTDNNGDYFTNNDGDFLAEPI